jgi:fumarylacetoacetase
MPVIETSWIPNANESGFSLANLPYGVAELAANDCRVCVAIGDYALDLSACARRGLLDTLSVSPAIWSQENLNSFLALGGDKHRAIRQRLRVLLAGDENRGSVEASLMERRILKMKCPVAPGDFVDFYSSYHHAARTMQLMRSELHQNWKSMPVGYHSRTGTIIGSDQPIYRPKGQILSPNGPIYAPSRALDIELEVGFVICRNSERGSPIKPSEFDGYVFGLVLLNDWSARDIQRFESTPLGPFLAKSFCTQVGDWVVPLEALEDHRTAKDSTFSDTTPEYLRHEGKCSFDISLEVGIESRVMRERRMTPQIVCRTNFKDMYWDGAQQLAHLTANGASVRVGDLYGSGTVSGPTEDSAGCFVEITQGGSRKIQLVDGSNRDYLLDGDRIVLRGFCESADKPFIDFGTLSGTVFAPFARN